MRNEHIIVTGMIVLMVCCSIGRCFEYDGLHWPDNDIPVDYYINTSGRPGNISSTDFITAVEDAFQTWTVVPGSYMEFDYRGTRSRRYVNRDNRNIVCWNSDGSDMGESTLAATHTWYNTSTDEIIECDVEFNGTMSWSVSGANYDIETVMLHEAGHWLHLGHEDAVPSIMATYYQAIRRTLYQDDMDGISFIYPYQLPTVEISGGPSGRTSDSTPTFMWIGSAGENPIATYNYDLDNPTPTTGSNELSHTFNTVPDGNHSFYIRAIDTIGKPSDVVSRSFTVDTTPAEISHTPVDWWVEGYAIGIAATVIDSPAPSMIGAVTLHYRTAGDSDYQTSAMIHFLGDTYTGSIPLETVSTAGVEYFITASDTVGNAPATGVHPGSDQNPNLIIVLARTDDEDSDSVSNHDEFIAGTDPYDGNDFFTISEIIEVEATDLLEISWMSVTGRTYRLLWTDVLDSGWNAAGGLFAVQEGTGGQLSFIDDGVTTYGDSAHAPLAPAVSQRFYRIDIMFTP